MGLLERDYVEGNENHFHKEIPLNRARSIGWEVSLPREPTVPNTGDWATMQITTVTNVICPESR